MYTQKPLLKSETYDYIPEAYSKYKKPNERTGWCAYWEF